jgi:hypothetical protein
MVNQEHLPNRKERKHFFETALLMEAPKLLSKMDRCPTSASSGCLDREYWAWATKDFSNMDMQRGVYVLSYLYKVSFSGNIYYQKSALLDWIALGIQFWINKQDQNGAFDHLYVNESSWMATAFTLVDFLETYKLLSSELVEPLKSDFLKTMDRCANFLTQKDEEHGFISNHRAAAAAGLMSLANLLGNEKYKHRAWILMDSVYAHQSKEGWFQEYEGPDPGYQTLDTHYQAIFYSETQDPKVLSAVSRSLDFLSYFLHPGGSIGGEYGSRGCPHFFPGGFEAFAEELSLSEALAQQGTMGLARGNSCGLADSDERNSIPLATSYVLAHKLLCKEGDFKSTSLPWEREFERFWPFGGLYIRSEYNNYLIFGASKGGVLKVYNKNTYELVYSSCGYVGVSRNGKNCTTLLWTSKPKLQQEGLPEDSEAPLSNSQTIKLETPFFEFQTMRLMTPIKFILFRIFNLTIGKIRWLNEFVRKNLIIKRFLTKREEVPAKLIRELILNSKGEILIEDTIQTAHHFKFQDLRERGFFSTVYMASSKYFRNQDFVQSWESDDLSNQFFENILKRSKQFLKL